MTRPLGSLPRSLRWLALAPAVLLLCGLTLSAFHHHENESAHAPCAVCSAGHAPAVTTAAAPQATQVSGIAQRLFAQPDARPRDRTPIATPSRAPPLA